jgi:hypothetical protein
VRPVRFHARIAFYLALADRRCTGRWLPDWLPELGRDRIID